MDLLKAFRPQQRGNFLYATDGREILHNTPDGWEVGAPQLWWTGPAGGDGTGGPWGNPPPGANDVTGHWSLPAVTRCTNLIAATLAGLPWVVGKGDDTLGTPTWITDPQLLRPDPRLGNVGLLDPSRLSAVEFWTQWITSALWFGDGYIFCPVRNAAGEPVPPLWQLSPHRVSIDNGRYYLKGNQPDYVNGGVSDEIEIDPSSLIHLRGNPPYADGHGTGVISCHGAELGLAQTVRSYALGQFSSGVPAGFLKVNKPEIQQKQADDLKMAWMRAHGNSRRSIAVLNATTDFTPIALSPLDAQLSDARQWSLRDVALAFGVPSWFLGIPGDSSTYSNVESRFIELRTYTLLPWIRRVESTLDAQFPLGTDVKVKTAGLERGDTTTRYAAYEAAIRAGWMLPNEARALEDLPPLPEPDPEPEPPAPPVPVPTDPAPIDDTEGIPA